MTMSRRLSQHSTAVNSLPPNTTILGTPVEISGRGLAKRAHAMSQSGGKATYCLRQENPIRHGDRRGARDETALRDGTQNALIACNHGRLRYPRDGETAETARRLA